MVNYGKSEGYLVPLAGKISGTLWHPYAKCLVLVRAVPHVVVVAQGAEATAVVVLHGEEVVLRLELRADALALLEPKIGSFQDGPVSWLTKGKLLEKLWRS